MSPFTRLTLDRMVRERWPSMTYGQRCAVIDGFRGWLLWTEAQNETRQP